MSKKHFDDKLIDVEIEKTKLNIEKTTLIFNKAILLYFSFLFIGVIGLMNGYITGSSLNIIIIMGIIALVIGTIPYMVTTKKEDQKLTELMDRIKKRGN